ncbi:MAG: phenylalanine--tRNA ligase subunit beta [candidate division Zixibacteria bacterium]|nr:phenylalanine--tRNA ligase subunit beta [candidate division Zixibacteria bacterium]
MKISYNWLRELTGLDWSPEEMGDRLTLCGTACEHIESTARYMDRVLVAEVSELHPVPGADKIQRAVVDTGSERLDVICGAPNVAVGQKVPLATIGATLAGDIKITKAKIRGVVSYGMICSERELGLSDDHSGILVLDPDAPAGKSLVEYLDFDDYMLTFELTPNRPDSMSAIGIARDLAALASLKVTRPTVDLSESAESASDFISVSIDDPLACPRYAARVIRNVKVAPSPWWIRKKLWTAGIRPISNVVDITNLVMLECGHPLHAFDLDRFGSDRVVVRRARDKEKFVTLDGSEHELTENVLLITNGITGVAAAGVMGGMDSEVEDNTTNVLLEAAFFDASIIRKSRKELGIVSESSSRFEKGADPNGIEYAIDRAADLFCRVCGGEVLSTVVDCYPGRIEPKTIDFRPRRCNTVLGTDISTDRMRRIFTDLEFGVGGSETLEVTVPTFRPDIEREIDLIEEVVRIEGFDSVEDSVVNIGALFTPTHYEDHFNSEMRHVLLGTGFDEMVGHGLADSRFASLLNPDLPQVRITNPVSEELNIMRNSLVHTALGVIGHNLAHRNMDLRLFEIGKAYFPPADTSDFHEEERVVLAVTGSTPRGWRGNVRPLDFYDLTGALECLVDHFRWPQFKFTPRRISFLDESLSFRITAGNQPVGWVGRIPGNLARKTDIKQSVLVAELVLAPLIAVSGSLVQFRPLPVYPAAPRDLAIVVDQRVSAGEIVECVRQAAGDLAESVNIFDLYAGEQIEKGKKSVAISISYRSPSGSLSGDAVDEKQRLVTGSLKQMLLAEIRDK